MKLSVSLKIPETKFRSEWDDPVAASHAFVRFAEKTWKDDLAELAKLGVEIEVRVGISNRLNPPEPGIDIKISPYTRDQVDMMQQTRDMLTAEKELWKKFTLSDRARELYR